MSTLLKKPWMRALLLFWGVIFPIVFVALPILKMATGEAPLSAAPLWPFLLWFLSPLAVAIVMKQFGGGGPRQEERQD